METLKAKEAFVKVNMNTDLQSFKRFDVRFLLTLLEQGSYTNTDKYKLYNSTDFSKKSNYERLPRCYKYNISERFFENQTFGYDDFYDYWTDKQEIIIDYCRVFLSTFPHHKKTLKILKELQISDPEFFI